MANSTQPARIVAGTIVGVIIGAVYVAGLTGLLYYTEMRDRQNDSLQLYLEAEQQRREELRGLVSEIVQDNKDLAAIAGRHIVPPDYPIQPDPSIDPRTHNQR